MAIGRDGSLFAREGFLRLDYYIPSAPLRSLLTAHAIATDVFAPVVDTLPAMLPNLHIRLAGGTRYAFGGGEAVPAPRVALIGLTGAAYRMALDPGLDIVTTGLLPEGWLGLVGAPATEFSDRVIDGEALWGRRKVDRLCDRLLSAPGDNARIAVLEAFLSAQMRAPSEANLTLSAIIDHWLEHSPDLSLDGLRDSLDVSARHMRRLTLDLHGASPKTLAMKYRSLRAASIMAIHGQDGLENALLPFADQSHLIRDFRRFVGWTPMTFVRERQNIAYATISGRWKAGAIRPLSLLS